MWYRGRMFYTDSINRAIESIFLPLASAVTR